MPCSPYLHDPISVPRFAEFLTKGISRPLVSSTKLLNAPPRQPQTHLHALAQAHIVLHTALHNVGGDGCFHSHNLHGTPIQLSCQRLCQQWQLTVCCVSGQVLSHGGHAAAGKLPGSALARLLLAQAKSQVSDDVMGTWNAKEG